MPKLFKKKYVRWVDSSGNRVARTASGARKVTGESAKWYGSVFDPAMRTWSQVPLCTDRKAAEDLLRQKISKAERLHVGLGDPFEQHRVTLLVCPACESTGVTGGNGAALKSCEKCGDAHLSAFRKRLAAKNGSPSTPLEGAGDVAKHVNQTISRLRKAFAGCNADRLAELSASRLMRWLADERQSGRLSTKTVGYYIQTAKQFGDWLVLDRRWGENPFDVAEKPKKGRTEVELERRVLNDEEANWLVTAAERSEITIRGLTGKDRAAIYSIALLTGLRASEIASLSQASFLLHGDEPTVTVEAGYSKRRRREELPLHPDLAVRLCPLMSGIDEKPSIRLAGRSVKAGRRSSRLASVASERLWPGDWRNHAAEIAKRDLAAARMAWVEDAGEDHIERERRLDEPSFLRDVDDGGAKFDFHALRHTFISNLARADLHPKQAQRLARHSTITLTMDRYTHLSIADDRAALGRLPGIGEGLGQQSSKATGTDDQSAAIVDIASRPTAAMAAHRAARKGVRSCPSLSSAGTKENARTPEFIGDSGVFSEEALVGVEPTVADLQSAALATWLQRPEFFGNLGELPGRVKPSWQ